MKYAYISAAALIKRAASIPPDMFARLEQSEGSADKLNTDTGGLTRGGVSEKAGYSKAQIRAMGGSDVRKVWDDLYAKDVAMIKDPTAAEVALHLRGNAGPSVYARHLQEALNEADPTQPPITVDGVLGSGTRSRLSALQNHRALAPLLLKRMEQHQKGLATANPAKYGEFEKGGWSDRRRMLGDQIAKTEPAVQLAPRAAPAPTNPPVFVNKPDAWKPSEFKAPAPAAAPKPPVTRPWDSTPSIKPVAPPPFSSLFTKTGTPDSWTKYAAEVDLAEKFTSDVDLGNKDSVLAWLKAVQQNIKANKGAVMGATPYYSIHPDPGVVANIGGRLVVYSPEFTAGNQTWSHHPEIYGEDEVLNPDLNSALMDYVKEQQQEEADALPYSWTKTAAISADKAVELHEACKATNTDPTDAQKVCGNYKKGRLQLRGYEIAIENPKGSTRSGTSPNGKLWKTTMQNSYGYFVGSKASDNDPVDVFIGADPENDPIWVIDQTAKDGKVFDEPKVILGAKTEQDARDLYLAHYEEGWTGLGAIKKMTDTQFKTWIAEKPSGAVSLGRIKEASIPDSWEKTAAPNVWDQQVQVQQEARSGVDNRGWFERNGGLQGLGVKAMEKIPSMSLNLIPSVFLSRLGLRGAGALTSWGTGVARDVPWLANKVWTGKSEGPRPSTQYEPTPLERDNQGNLRDIGATGNFIDRYITGGGADEFNNSWGKALNIVSGRKTSAPAPFTPRSSWSTNRQPAAAQGAPSAWSGGYLSGGTAQPKPTETPPVYTPKADSDRGSLYKPANFAGLYAPSTRGPKTYADQLGENFKGLGTAAIWSIPRMLAAAGRGLITGKHVPEGAYYTAMGGDAFTKGLGGISPILKPVGGFLDGTVGNLSNWAKWMITGRQ